MLACSKMISCRGLSWKPHRWRDMRFTSGRCGPPQDRLRRGAACAAAFECRCRAGSTDGTKPFPLFNTLDTMSAWRLLRESPRSEGNPGVISVSAMLLLQPSQCSLSPSLQKARVTCWNCSKGTFLDFARRYLVDGGSSGRRTGYPYFVSQAISLFCFHPETAQASGIKSPMGPLFFVMLGVIIALSIKLVGTLLVFGFLVLPVTALLLSQHLGGSLLSTSARGNSATVLGFMRRSDRRASGLTQSRRCHSSSCCGMDHFQGQRWHRMRSADCGMWNDGVLRKYRKHIA